MKVIFAILIAINIGLFLAANQSLAWEGGPTGVCTDAHGNVVPCDSGSGSDDSGGYDTGSSESTGSSWGTWGSSTPTNTGPTWQERQQALRESKGVSLNEQANRYYQNGDFETAVNYYRQAIAYSPDDPVIQQNLIRAEGSLANLKGNQEFEKGNYAAAANHYRQAAQLKPESDVIRKNLANAEEMVSGQQEWEQEKAAMEEKRAQHERRMAGVATEVSGAVSNIARELKPAATTQSAGLQLMGASSQLKSAQLHSQQAAASSNMEMMKAESAKGFDTAGVPMQGLKPLDLQGVPQESRDPIVPSELRTPKITQFEKERTAVRNKRWETEKKLEQLQSKPKQDTKKIAELKQEISNAENKEHFLNFSINDELRKAPQVKKGTSKK